MLGKVVIVAGTIVEAVNTQEGTRLVLLQYPTSSRGRPKTDEPSGGRFLVLTSESLETAIIAQDAPLRWLAKCVDNGNSLSVRRSIVIPSWRHVKCISGLRVVAVPRSSTLVLALG